MNKNNLSREEKRTKKALKYYKHRHLRNFFIWLWGVISFVLILVGVVGIVLGVIPAKQLFGEEKAGKASEGTLLEVIMDINEYSFGDIPFAKDLVDSITSMQIINDKKISDFVKIKVDDLDSMKITEFAKNLTSNPAEMIEIVATLDGVIGIDSLGDFKNLSAFSVWEPVTTEVSPEDEGFVASLYYYKDGEEYKRAFDNEKNKLAPATATLYYGALAYVPIPDALNLVSERFGREKITSLISNLGGAEFSDDSVLTKLLGDTTINGVGDLTLDKIYLDSLVPEANNKALYTILRSACVDKLGPNDPVSLQNIANGLDMEKITLSGFLDIEEYEMFFNILCDALDTNPNDNIKIDPHDITIADLGNFNIANTKVSALLGEKDKDNETIYNLLCSASGVSDYKNLSVNHLSSLSLNDVYLVDIIEDNADNKVIFDTIMELNPGVAKNKLKIEHLSGINFNNMKLSSVVNNTELLSFISENLGIIDPTISDLSSLSINGIKLKSVLPYNAQTENTYKLLLSCFAGLTHDTLTVEHLKTFNIDNVKLQDILGERTDNLYLVLCQASNVDSVSKLTISSLTSSSFDIGNVELSTVVSDQENLFNILKDATGKKASDKLTISDLSSFDINKISLSSVLPSPEIHLRDLMEDACDIHPYENIKLSHLTGTTFNIDNVYLYHIMAAPAGLKNILEDVYGDYNSIKFGDIHNGFDLGEVHLSSVILNDTGNAILDNLRHDETVTISNIGEKLDALSLYKVYGENVFTTSSSSAIDTTRKFSKTINNGKDEFILSDTGNYFISKDAGVWLLLCFDGQEHINGTPKKYVQSNLSISNMQSGSGLSDVLSTATVRELIDAGIINAEISNPTVLAMTITEVVQAIS